MTTQKNLRLNHDEILTYWFGTLSDDLKLDMQSETCQRWHAKSPQTDAQIRHLFLSSHKTALSDASTWVLTSNCP
jgi:uncharacterized protein (DUF924 family)